MIGLRAVTAIAISLAQLFQLVVQVFHRVISSLVSVYDQPQARSLTGSACAERPRDTTPVQPDRPDHRQPGGSSLEDGVRKSNGS